MIPHLTVSEEILAAQAAGRPVVALESTIVAHGMPHPENVATAREVEQIVRDAGAVPATVAIIGGMAKVGLDHAELERLGREGSRIAKVSTRDLAYAVAQGRDGATTVAATMRIAAMAGIHVFATGGIGGAHRGAAQSFDISADLSEFSSCDVAVVSAGAKAILDLALTLELLETMSVPVVGYQTSEFPAFYSRRSGLALSQRCDSPQEVAALMRAKWSMGISGGILIANPIPPAAEMPAAEIAPIIAAAIEQAERQGMAGKEVTPFLLAEVAAATHGRSLAANIALVKNNARVAAEIAAAYARSVP